MTEIKVKKVNSEEILPLRNFFLRENSFQFIHNKCHEYGWADSYLFSLDNEPVGYGALWGAENRLVRDTIFEFYIRKPYRGLSGECFSKFLAVSGAIWLSCQTNDVFFSSQFYQYAQDINTECILFEDRLLTNLFQPGLPFLKREITNANRMDEYNYSLVHNKEIIATGGLLLNYNEPFADLYMEVLEVYRGQGWGSFLVQELKKICYGLGRIPAARCNIRNNISRATLQKAGMGICGFLLKGRL